MELKKNKSLIKFLLKNKIKIKAVYKPEEAPTPSISMALASEGEIEDRVYVNISIMKLLYIERHRACDD